MSQRPPNRGVMEATVKGLYERHVVYTRVPTHARERMEKEMHRRCEVLVQAYEETLARTFASLNLLVDRMEAKRDSADALVKFHAPLLTPLTRDAVMKRASVHEAEAEELQRQIDAIMRRPDVAAAQQRVATCLAPAFVSAEVAKCARESGEDSELRAIMARVLDANEPRAQIVTTAANGDPVATVNAAYGVKHLHRPCKSAAPCPFGVPGQRWRAVRLRANNAGVRDHILGGKYALALQADDGAYVIVGGSDGGFPAPVSPVLRLPPGSCTVETLVDVTKMGLPRAAIKSVTRAPAGGMGDRLSLPCSFRHQVASTMHTRSVCFSGSHTGKTSGAQSTVVLCAAKALRPNRRGHGARRRQPPTRSFPVVSCCG